MAADNTSTSHEQVLKELQGLGFSDYEAKTYIALLLTPNATAYEISKAAGIPKANCYTVLENLRKKVAVQPVSESPVKYVAIDPKKFFSTMAAKTQQRCDNIQESLNKIAEFPQEDLVWSLNDTESVHKQVEKIIRAATRHLWIKASEATLQRHFDALQAAADKGVAILIILFGTDVGKFNFGKNCTVHLHEGNGIAVGIAHTLITMTRDFEEALVATTGPDSYGSYTKNKPVVNMAESLLRHEIYFAEIFKIYGTEIQNTFGPALIKLRQSYLPKEQVKTLKARLKAQAALHA